MKKCPCTKDCPDRTKTCHDTCRRYIDWKADMRAAKEAYRDDARIGRHLNDSRIRALKKVAKGGGKKWTNS